METLQINDRVEVRFQENANFRSKKLNNNAKFFIDFQEKSGKLELHEGQELMGQILLFPLFSNSENNSKKAVWFSDLQYSGFQDARLLIKEALMICWELDFQVAFVNTDNQLYLNSGFEKSTKIFPFYNQEHPLLHAELTWNGMENIPNDLIFPLNINPFKILS